MITQILLVILCCAAIVQDIISGKIRNMFNVISAVVAFVCILITREISMKDSLSGLGFSVLLGMGMWRIGAIRAGDAKFMWTMGILKGWKGFGVSMIYALLAGGIMALGIILMKKDFKRRILHVWLYLKNMILFHHMERYEPENKDKFPFAVPLAVGCILDMAVKL